LSFQSLKYLSRKDTRQYLANFEADADAEAQKRRSAEAQKR